MVLFISFYVQQTQISRSRILTDEFVNFVMLKTSVFKHIVCQFNCIIMDKTQSYYKQ